MERELTLVGSVPEAPGAEDISAGTELAAWRSAAGVLAELLADTLTRGERAKTAAWAPVFLEEVADYCANPSPAGLERLRDRLDRWHSLCEGAR